KAAVQFSTLAAGIAESIEANAYPFDVLMKLRATAFREKAWCLYFVGSFPESVAALDRADEYLRQSIVSECDRAEVTVLRARVYRDLERYAEAAILAQHSGLVFRAYGNAR